MSKLNINSNNIKLTILDNGKDTIDCDDCYFEIILNKNFLELFLLNLVLMKDSTFNGNISLTEREKEILKCLSFGQNNSQIAKNLHVSIHTAKVHIHNIFSKLSVQDRTEAVVKAIKYRLIEI